MKIRKIKYHNNPLFGDLEFDFTDSNGKTVDTIIIAGENGVGKSYLLNNIFEFSSLTLRNNKRDEKRIFEIELSNKEMEILKEGQYSKQYFTSDYKKNIFIVSIDYSIINSWDQIDVRVKGMPRLIGTLFSQDDTRQILKTIFSDVEINFTPKEIKTVTSSNIDRNNILSQRSNSNLATEITQLLIDVQSLDALEFTEWARNNSGQPIDEKKIDVRIKRFTSAFDFMFPRKKYKRIENLEGRKEIIFEEDGKEMSIAKLSSGEKQIVFRGSFLLKDKESSKEALILIDEPEISLHPSWQLKVLSFFKKLFTNESGRQTSQIIISTHSPFVIHNANRNDDKVIILQKDANGQVFVPNESKFYGWSNEKIIQEAFDLNKFVTENKVTVFLEGETDEKYYNKCLEIFDEIDLAIEFKWIGRINEKGNVENTGDTALNQAKVFFTANMEQIKNKVVLFYDSDTNKPEEDIQNLLIRKMNVNDDNKIFKIGVENLLVINEDFDFKAFYKERIKTDNYGAESVLRELDKTKLCSFICDELNPEKQKEVLFKIKNEITRILK
ncbi:AAA family ATPase [Flavobacterium denitrificans]|uniref:AAA family ATPase n=1 Tax=Flavobacterium denitrificans TaxID=281361 RepID=UPI00040412DA|nr:ATP-binding protein [Flavobacterium denitrificans]